MLYDFHTHKRRPGVISILSAAADPGDGGPWSAEAHPWRHGDIRALAAAAERADAVGEAGLDRLRGGEFPDQEAFFEAVCAVAERLSKPLILHEVRAAEAAARVLSRHAPPAVLRHGWRSPDTAKLEAALNLGWYVGCSRHTPETVWRCFGGHPEFLGRLAIESDDDAEADMDMLYSEAGKLTGLGRAGLEALMEENFHNFLGV